LKVGARRPSKQAALKLILSPQMMARPYVAPPGIPPERLNALRAAFDATMKDPGVSGGCAAPGSGGTAGLGPEAAALIDEIYASPRAVVKLAIEVMKE